MSPRVARNCGAGAEPCCVGDASRPAEGRGASYFARRELSWVWLGGEGGSPRTLQAGTPGSARPGRAPSHPGRHREVQGTGTEDRRPPALLAFPPRAAETFKSPPGTAGVERPERRRRPAGGRGWGGGRWLGEPRGHSPARVVVDVLQHRVPEEGAGGALEAHGALRVQVVGAGGGSRGHQRQEQRAEPPGAPPRRRAAHPQPTPPSRCPASGAQSGAAGSGRPEAPGAGAVRSDAGEARRGAGRGAERARKASTRAAGAGGVLGPAEKSARSHERVPGPAALDCGEARPPSGRRDGGTARQRPLRAAGPFAPPGGDGRDGRQAPGLPHLPAAPWEATLILSARPPGSLVHSRAPSASRSHQDHRKPGKEGVCSPALPSAAPHPAAREPARGKHHNRQL